MGQNGGMFAALLPRRLREAYALQDTRTRFRWWMLGTAAVLTLALALLTITDRSLRHYFDPARANPPDRIVILTTTWCPYCRLLRQALAAAHLPYDEIDVEQDWKAGYAYYATLSRGVPVTVIGNETIRQGLSAQLRAIRALCDRTNQAGAYDCARLDDPMKPGAGRSTPKL